MCDMVGCFLRGFFYFVCWIVIGNIGGMLVWGFCIVEGILCVILCVSGVVEGGGNWYGVVYFVGWDVFGCWLLGVFLWDDCVVDMNVF